MAKHKLQDALDGLPTHILDAQRLYGLTAGMLVQLREERIAAGGGGNGAPPSVHKTLNRAIILAAVGAWEAFTEDLATAAVALDTSDAMKSRKDWAPITGTKSLVQTPSPRNVRHLMWGLFAYDPLNDWEVRVSTSEVEMPATTGTNGWRGKSQTHQGKDAALFLAATVANRHITAHQDRSKKVQPIAGMAQVGANGGANVGFHHAENAVGAVMQLAVQTTHGLARHLNLDEKFRWKMAMGNNTIADPGTSDWRWWLDGTSALKLVEDNWTAYP